MKRLLKKLRRRTNSPRLPECGQRRYRTFAGIESLEDRRLMAVDYFGSLVSNSPSYVSQQSTVANAPALATENVGAAITAIPVFSLLPGSQVRANFDAGDGILRVVGTEQGDKLRVVETDGRLSVQTYVRGLAVTGQGVWSTLNIAMPGGGSVASLDAVSVNRAEMYGWGGNDSLKYMQVATPHANPWLLIANSSYSRAVWAQSFEVEMFGGEGNDTLEVLAGAKAVLDGGGGRDTLIGSWGDDILTGGGGDDSLFGNDGNDRLVGGAGVNTIDDGFGDDRVDFSANDVGVVYATAGGNDTVIGTAFDDVLVGSYGIDTLAGNDGNDQLFGNAGNDTLVGGAGINAIDDGFGDDTIDFSANDFPVYFATFGGHDTVIGSAFDDILTGSDGNDTLQGNGGNDQLYGLEGFDTLDGGTENDWLEAGSAGESVLASDGMDYDAHVWVVGGMTPGDVRQTIAETCVFLSSLASAASVGMDLESRITYLGNFTFQVQLFNWDTEDVHYENVTFDGTLIDGDPVSMGGEYWTVLYQRAYLQMMTRNSENFRHPEYALYALTGREVEDGDSPSEIAEALYYGRIVVAGAADDGGPVYEKHAYTVLDAYYQNDEWFVRLRNPWGRDVKDPAHTPSGDPNDGIIEMTWDQFWDEYDFDRLSIS
jgi:Ca2+-binding RTX toxin-like protein